MLTGFEDITYELTPKEVELVNGFVKGFKNKVGAKNAITSTQIIKLYKAKGENLTGARVRKIVNFIRTNKLIINLIATSKGYYIENDPEKLEKYKESLQQRVNEITRVLNSYM